MINIEAWNKFFKAFGSFLGRLNFNNLNQMWVADEDHIVFYDGYYHRCKGGLYKTEQDAIDAAAKKNAEVVK